MKEREPISDEIVRDVGDVVDARLEVLKKAVGDADHPKVEGILAQEHRTTTRKNLGRRMGGTRERRTHEQNDSAESSANTSEPSRMDGATVQ